jgi:colanic acid biosynthesis glycosyl transferase WcaI
MNILIINQFFWPDSAATAQLLADLTSAIDPKLHAVTVLCGPPSYGVADMQTGPPPAKIVRIGATAFSRGKITRFLSYVTFFGASAVCAFREPRPDIVVTLTTPPLISLVGTLLRWLRDSRHFIWEMDLYPDIAVDLQVLKPRSLVTKLIEKVADFSRKHADGIIVLGEDMKHRLATRSISLNNIYIAENWADGKEILPVTFKEGPLTVHYSGTFGLVHEEQTIAEAMRELRNDNKFLFVFSGGGARREHLEKFCRAERIDNVEFRPYVNRADLGQALSEGHLGLVTQQPKTVGSIVPSKLYGIMGAGRPVLFIGPEGSTPAEVIRKFECGWQITPGDTGGLVRLLGFLQENRHMLLEAGKNARFAFEKHYDKPIGVARVLSVLEIQHSSVLSGPPSTVASATQVP